MEETKVSFRPVRGKESDMIKISPIDGYVYFTTDTQKIYCAQDNKFIPMGGNSGVYYGNPTFSEDESNTGETDFIFNMIGRTNFYTQRLGLDNLANTIFATMYFILYLFFYWRNMPNIINVLLDCTVT